MTPLAGFLGDLLGTRRPEEYAWSEFDHHAAGFFVVLVGLLAVLASGACRWS